MKLMTLFVLFIFSSASVATTEKMDLGQKIYQKACSNCHAPEYADSPMKAPTAFDKTAWKQRLIGAAEEAKKNPKKYKNALAYLVQQVKIGKGLMHHGGLCRESATEKKNCSDAALLAAIKYMITPQQK